MPDPPTDRSRRSTPSPSTTCGIDDRVDRFASGKAGQHATESSAEWTQFIGLRQCAVPYGLHQRLREWA